MWHSSGQWAVSKSLRGRVSLSTHTQKPKPCSEWRCNTKVASITQPWRQKPTPLRMAGQRDQWGLCWHYWTAAPCLESLPPHFLSYEKNKPNLLGSYKSGFQFLIAGRLPDAYTHIFCFLGTTRESHSAHSDPTPSCLLEISFHRLISSKSHFRFHPLTEPLFPSIANVSWIMHCMKSSDSLLL